ncbi:hypothetical protein BDZ45DRAFT_680085 [Acephala macrosclerotiorum]|nr:hypothetical protein BDZ45DRAFT_680085 [Acephala macrosclerotiorum]
MPRLARRAVWHTVRSAGRVRRGWRSSHSPYTQNSFPNRERSLDPSICYHIDNRIRSGTTSSPELFSSHQKPKPKLPINSVKLKDQNKGLQALSLAEEAIFYSRLISSVSTGVWISRIAEYIPTNVKLILRFKPNGKQVSIRKTDYLCIGSISGYSGSLRINRRHKALISKIKRFDLTPDGEFITLFVVPFKNGSKDEVMNDLVLVKLARMVLMIWLGAVDEGWEPAIKDLVPWGLENIEYHGLAGGSPLATNFKGRYGTKKGGNHKGTE